MRRYEVIEVPNGWRVVEHHANGTKFHQKLYRTRTDALRRADALIANQQVLTALSDVRKRAKFRCECTGECGIHVRRCTYRLGVPLPGTGAVVALKVVARDHNTDNLELDNLRAYCQLCQQRHEAEERNTDPLFEIG